MASVSLERIMDRVSLVFDCETADEATELYNLLASQALDGHAFHVLMSDESPNERRERAT